MKRLWAPWRLSYIVGSQDKNPSDKKSDCVFCKMLAGKGGDSLILHRSSCAFVILNKYPYGHGHLMVIPNRHIHDYTRLSAAEHREMGLLNALCIKILKKAYGAHGFNVGMNLGEIAGAGIRSHLHYHIVPRWSADHNFMPIISDVRVMPEYLAETHQRLLSFFRRESQIRRA